MSEQRSGLGKIARSFRARRSQPGEHHTYRLASSIRLIWGLGLAVMLILSLAVGLLVGRVSDEEFKVPGAMVDFEAGIARQSAQSVRRSVNEGVDDIASLAQTLSLTDAASLQALLDAGQGKEGLSPILHAFVAIHGRYSSIYVLRPDGTVAASVGERARPDLVLPPYDTAGVTVATLADRTQPLIIEYAPLPMADGSVGTVVAHYDPTFLSFPLEAALPGDAWVVDPSLHTVGGLQAPQYVELPRDPLTEAASRGKTGETGAFVTAGSIDKQEIIGYAPVVGDGAAGQLGWSVVADRTVASLALPQTQTRSQGQLAGFVLVLATLLIFGGLYIVLIYPILRLQKEADRLAFGDLSRPVEIVRYDEIGLIARALERMRVLLIRRRAPAVAKRPAVERTPAGSDPPAGDPLDPEA